MRTISTITVADLLELLQDEDPTALVVFAADYGDHSHTEQALPLRGAIEEVEIVEEAGYSNSGWAIPSHDEDDEEDDEDRPTVLVIR